MAEGTKIGEFKDDLDFNVSVRQESDVDDSEYTATKIGELSEDEKALYAETGQEDQGSEIIQATKEPVSKPKEEKSLFELEMEETVVDFCEGDVIKGIVRSVEKGGLLIDMNYKSDGFVPSSELGPTESSKVPSDYQPGQEIDVFIEKLETKEGYTILSERRAIFELAWNQVIRIARTKDVITVRTVNKVEGGLVADYQGIKGFIPASHVVRSPEDDLEEFLDRELSVVVLQADRKRRKVIFSYKLAKSRPQPEELEKLLEEIEIGVVREGKVSSIKDFGAFVDIGGVEGLVHISEISWARVSHPSEKLNVGDEVKVFVLGVDRENRKISLGMKQLQPDPWVNVGEKFSVGDIVKGEITRIVTFGAFMKVDENLEGLIHISELSTKHVNKVEDVVTIGDERDAKIIKLVPDDQKIGLSLRQVEEYEASQADVSEEETTENDVAASAEPVSENGNHSVEPELDQTQDVEETADSEETGEPVASAEDVEEPVEQNH